MPALRVKVSNYPGQKATRIELPADVVYQDGIAMILGAVGMGPDEGVLSLNKKEPVSLGLQERMFQGVGFRPGDLVWVVPSNPDNLPAQQPLQAPERCIHSECVRDDHAEGSAKPETTQTQHSGRPSAQHVVITDAGPAFTAACDAIRARATASATAVCRCIVQSCFLDSGCVAASCEDTPEQQAQAALNSTAGYFQTQFVFPAIATNQAVKLMIFPMGHHQILYTSLPGSGFSQRQLVFQSERFEGASALSPAVLASTYSVVRDRVFTWAVNACLLKAGQQQGLGLMALPGEALRQVVTKLAYGDVAAVASVCKRLATAASDSSVWREVYKQEFKKDVPDAEEPISAFRSELAERNRLRTALHQVRRPGGFRGPPNPGLYIPPYAHVPFPGAIGGEYDRRPGRIWIGGGSPWITGTDPSPAGINGGGRLHARGPFGGMGRPQDNAAGFGGRRFI